MSHMSGRILFGKEALEGIEQTFLVALGALGELGVVVVCEFVLAINGTKGLCGEVVGGMPPDAGAEDLDAATVEHQVVSHGRLIAVGR